MQIALFGYGKMGTSVERIARERGHDIHILKFPASDKAMDEMDVAIDFTRAEIAPTIVRYCIEQGKPVVSGTTGWNAGVREIRSLCEAGNGTFLWAPNFSVGMHVTFAVNSFLAGIMEHLNEYDVRISETHHTAKKDAPSGTAIALAEQILDQLSRKTSWQLHEDNAALPDEVLKITAIRESDVRGIHEVNYKSPQDVISFRHEAISRDGFALGAVMAAEWLEGRKKGAYNFDNVMADLTGLK